MNWLRARWSLESKINELVCTPSNDAGFVTNAMMNKFGLSHMVAIRVVL